MRKILLWLGLFGTAVFVIAFVLSFLQPILIENAAREIIRIEVEKRMGERLDGLSNTRIAGIARSMAEKAQIDIQQTEKELRQEVPKRVAASVANMMKPDCECRQRLIKFSEEVSSARLTSLIQFKERLTHLIESAYANVRDSLLREFRIFTTANALVFALLTAVTVIKRTATLQLMLPAAILLTSAGVIGCIYLFNQNWLHTIVFSEYVGWSYFSYLSTSILFLTDVLMNRARVTTIIVNAIGQTVGAAVSAIPC
jgi:hypothetical protein